MSDSSMVSVVSVAFRKVVCTGKFQHPFRRIGEPILEIEILGDRHNLKNVGELLFEHYLREVLDEDLDDRVWRFEPSETEAYPCLALNATLPILSDEMHASNPFGRMIGESASPISPFKIKEGSDLCFRYDEGSPTHLMATIESITAMPEGKSVESYPAKKVNPLEHLVGDKRKRLAEIPVLTITMDEAYPSLRYRLLSEHGVRLEIGNGSDPMPCKLAECAWARIWGGDPQAAYDRSLESFHAFDDMDEAWLCFDRAILKQTSPDFPAMTRLKEYKCRTTGEVYRQSDDSCLDLGIVTNVLPAVVPVEMYKKEMERDLPSYSTGVPSLDEDPLQRAWSRYCFNFALDRDWKNPEPQHEQQQQEDQRAAASNFSFRKQFPQCAAWLTHPCGTSHWMFLESGVLHAVKGKHNPKTGENVVHRTLKHTSLHALFTDLEDQLVLPKAWKIKKNA